MAGEHPEERPLAIGALLVATVLLRTGTVGAGAAVGFYLGGFTSRGSHPYTAAAGVVAAVQAVSEAVAAPILARYADRFGRSKFLVAGPLIGALGALLLVISRRPIDFAGARIFEGLGAAAFVPTALGTIAAATARNPALRAKSSAAFEGANLVGYALGFGLAGFVFHGLESRGFTIFAMFYVAAGLVCAIFLPRVPPLPVSPLRTVLRAVVGRGPIRSFLPAWVAAFALIGAYGANLPSVLQRCKPPDQPCPSPSQTLVHHLDERLISGMLTLWIITLVVGIVIWTPTLTRIGAAKTMRRAIPGGWVMSVGLLALNHTSLNAAAIFVPVALVGVLILAGFGPAAVTYLAECSETFASDRSALMSFYTVTLAGGAVIGDLLGSLAQAWFQVDGLIVLGAVLSLFEYVSLGPVLRYERVMLAARSGGSGSEDPP